MELQEPLCGTPLLTLLKLRIQESELKPLQGSSTRRTVRVPVRMDIPSNDPSQMSLEQKKLKEQRELWRTMCPSPEKRRKPQASLSQRAPDARDASPHPKRDVSIEPGPAAKGSGTRAATERLPRIQAHNTQPLSLSSKENCPDTAHGLAAHVASAGNESTMDSGASKGKKRQRNTSRSKGPRKARKTVARATNLPNPSSKEDGESQQAKAADVPRGAG
jgi:hypothetical protein